jgi:sulfofructose kinase
MSKFFACVGHASVDHHFEIDTFADTPTKTPAQSYRQIVGGMAANAALGMQRLGQAVHLIGRVGDDDAGRFIMRSVQELGITSHLETVPGGHTSVSSVIVDKQGERQIFNHRGDALAKAHALDTRQLEGAQALLADPRWGDGAALALNWARQRGVLGVLDADVAPRHVLQRLVPLASWAVFSQPGLACFAPDLNQQAALNAALDAGAQAAMVTLGEQGVAWMHAEKRQLLTQSSFKITALDTTGAGDVFHAALTIALSQADASAVGMATEAQERQAIRFACAAAALKCTQRHGALGAPTHAQVTHFLETHSPTS